MWQRLRDAAVFAESFRFYPAGTTEKSRTLEERKNDMIEVELGTRKPAVDAAPMPEAAATGLTVASALAAQGLERAAAVKAVGDAFRGGRTPQEVLEYPSVVTGLRAQGEPMAGIARRILEGGDVVGAGHDHDAGWRHLCK